jgi:hypothetical protein
MSRRPTSTLPPLPRPPEHGPLRFAFRGAPCCRNLRRRPRPRVPRRPVGRAVIHRRARLSGAGGEP